MSYKVHSLAFCSLMQLIGAGGMINEQCKDFVRQYVPQILHIIDTMPPDQVCHRLLLLTMQSHPIQPFVSQHCPMQNLAPKFGV